VIRFKRVSESNTFLNILRKLKHSFTRKLRLYRINKARKIVVAQSNNTVLNGPFKGLKLVDDFVFGSHLPKLLGCYEKELHPFFEQLLDAKQSTEITICNVGAAEGFYAVGLAKQENVKTVIVYENLEKGQKLTQQNAELNQVADKININGLCVANSLIALSQTTTIDFLVMDVEGAELDILSQDCIKHLSNSWLIVELHDFRRPNCKTLLCERFEQTHDLQVINAANRTLADFPQNISVPKSLAINLMDEQRPNGMQWLFAKPI